MFERLPTPWGLVRSGVAPDHPKIKSVSRVYEKTAAHPRFRYFGNVTFGEHVSREELLAHYHAVVYATGSPVGPPTRDTRRRPSRLARRDGVRRLVQRPPRLHRSRGRPVSAERAVVIGNGNVALDVARMLVLTAAELAPTDTADHALDVLARQPPARGGRGRPARARAGRLHEPRAARARRARRRRRDRRSARARARARASTDADADTDGADERRDPAQVRRARPPAAAGGSCCASCSLPSRCSPATMAPRRGRARAQRARARPGGSLRARPPASTRRSRRAWRSARSATAASRCRASPSTSARRSSPTTGGRVLDPRQRPPLPGEYVGRLDQARTLGVIGTNKRDAQETVDAILADLAPLLGGRRSEREARADPHRPSQPTAARRGATARAPARACQLQRLGGDRPS